MRVFLSLLSALILAAGGCVPTPSGDDMPELIWGRRGLSDGRFQKPRAMAIDRQDRIYVVDMTARIQVFDTLGRFLRSWQTPEQKAGRPSGLSIGIDGNLLVADTHYHRVLIYSPEGVLLRTLGGEKGEGPGQFGLVTDVVQDSRGNYYVGEYGEFDRIQKFSPPGQFIKQWGSPGSGPGQFARPQSLAIDADDQIWVADACNHRIQWFDTEGNLLGMWGEKGDGIGQLHYPYDVVLAPDGTVWVAEFGNHRIQQFTGTGRPIAAWGSQGRGPGELDSPWALVEDHQGRIHVLDTNNHRVQVVNPSRRGG